MNCFKCKMCGGDLNVVGDEKVVECEYCGTKQTVPNADDEKKVNLFNRANRLRMNSEFDKAASIYEQIIAEFPEEAEAYWCLCLCNYGIEYVDDPATANKVPTVHRASFDKLRKDENYGLALENADMAARIVYEDQAKEIDRIMGEILAVSRDEQPYDIFICYKETDNIGKRTPDSVLAQDIYDALTGKDYRVFFARITLEDKLGTMYEPYIFSALNSAKVMLAVGTDYEYFNAVWVKNEWSRFIKLMAKDKSKTLIPCYKNMDPYDMPDEFKPYQSQDCGKLGFMQDLTRGIDKLFGRTEQKAEKTVEKVIVQQGGNNATVNSLLERVFMFLEDGAWDDATKYCEKVLDIEPKNAEAYLGKLMAELKVKNRKQLKKCSSPFDSTDNYKKAMRFGSKELIAELKEDINNIKYTSACKSMKNAKSENAFLDVAGQFEKIGEYKDSAALAADCREKAKEIVYIQAKDVLSYSKKEEELLETAAEFERLKDYKNSASLAEKCHKKAKEIVYVQVKKNLPKFESEKDFLEAAAEFERLKGYKDSAVLAEQCRENAKETVYILAKQVLSYSKNESELLKTAAEFERLKDYKDSAELAEQCKDKITDIPYRLLKEQMEQAKTEKEYLALSDEFERHRDYKDCSELATECLLKAKEVVYRYADKLMKAAESQKEYLQAAETFAKIGGYEDSAEMAKQCRKKAEEIHSEEMRLENEKLAAANKAAKKRKAAICLGVIAAIICVVFAIVVVTVIIPNSKYNAAVSLLNDGKIIDAYESLVALNGYKDSATKASEIFDRYKIEKLKIAEVGDIVDFGAYEQDNNTSNGKEEIEWIVLEKENGKALFISKYALVCQQYNTEDTDVTWENCTLRKWLNDSFLNTAFNTEEQAQIQKTTVSADKNPEYSTDPGNATTDKVFLLSIAEAEKYFTTDEARKCASTAYAKAQEAYTNDSYKTASGEATCDWWLRSPGNNQGDAASVYGDGSVYYFGVFVNCVSDCVRPALWINLDF